MPAPDYTWLDPDALAEALGRTGEVPADVERARTAAAAYVEKARQDIDWSALTPETVDADHLAGASLYAARLLSRKASPGGIAAFGEFGASPVLRVDPDIERLLGLGRYSTPRVR